MSVLTLKPCTEERFCSMLDILPPALHLSHGFLVGEPVDHRTCAGTGRLAPTFAAFFNRGDDYAEALEPMTIPEFKAVTLAALVAAIAASKERVA